MNILAIDTSSLNASCAVLCSGVLTGEFSICNKKTHSQMLMPMLDDVLKKASMSIEDIDIFAPCIGPGSFTGLRIGIAAAKALCQARGKKIIGISALDSLAQNIAFSDKIVCPIMDARRGDVYNALYKNGEKIWLPSHTWVGCSLRKESAIILANAVFSRVLSKNTAFAGYCLMEGHKRRKGFYEEKANQSVGVRDNSAFSYVCVGAC